MKDNLMFHLTIDKIAAVYEKFGEKVLTSHRRRKLTNTDFSIISNNCWGGHVYRHFGLTYSSPTVGMYFFAEEYIKLLRNLRRNIMLPIRFIDPRDSKYSLELERKGQMNVPIGILGDEIEIVFLHYHSKDEAQAKWLRRRERINFDNLIVKNSEMNLCSFEHLLEFDTLPFKKKLLLVSKQYPQLSSAKIVRRYSVDGEVLNDTTWYSSFTDLTELINS